MAPHETSHGYVAVSVAGTTRIRCVEVDSCSVCISLATALVCTGPCSLN